MAVNPSLPCTYIPCDPQEMRSIPSPTWIPAGLTNGIWQKQGLPVLGLAFKKSGSFRTQPLGALSCHVSAGYSDEAGHHVEEHRGTRHVCEEATPNTEPGEPAGDCGPSHCDCDHTRDPKRRWPAGSRDSTELWERIICSFKPPILGWIVT